jgi:hypothetical protein
VVLSFLLLPAACPPPPQMPPTYNSWVQTEDMLLFHLRALQLQLEQLYIGMALAAAAGRAFVLPDLSCFCQNAEAPLARCRRPDSEKLQFPAACRENEVLMPLSEFGASDEARGTAVEVRHADLLERLSADTSEVRACSGGRWAVGSGQWQCDCVGTEQSFAGAGRNGCCLLAMCLLPSAADWLTCGPSFACLPGWLPACLPAQLPTCMSASLVPCLFSCLHACLNAARSESQTSLPSLPACRTRSWWYAPAPKSCSLPARSRHQSPARSCQHAPSGVPARGSRAAWCWCLRP